MTSPPTSPPSPRPTPTNRILIAGLVLLSLGLLTLGFWLFSAPSSIDSEHPMVRRSREDLQYMHRLLLDASSPGEPVTLERLQSRGVPANDSWGNPYRLESPPHGSTIPVPASNGPDGISNTKDDLRYAPNVPISEAILASGPTAISIFDCRDPRLDLDDEERDALATTGLTQCAMPFGVLLAADERMPETYVRLATAVLAEMLDQNLDGTPDDPDLVELLRDRDVAWLAMPTDEDDWERRQRPRLERVLGYDIVIPAWWLDVRADGPDARGRAVTIEEIHHFITQFGLSRLYPETFGVDDWTSVIARETEQAQCDFWQHPENDCPGSPAEYPGECRDPNCDVVEFYQQVVVLRAGMEPGWRGIGFPETAEELDRRLSDEIKAAMDDPEFHQLQRPLTFEYPVIRPLK
jgi:hypothetical protein